MSGVNGRTVSGAAFFDVDETLITVKSMFEFLRHWRAEHGDDGSGYRAEFEAIGALARAGAPREDVNREYFRLYRGAPATELAASGRRWFESFAAGGDGFYLDAVRALHHHRERGDLVVLVSGSFGAVLTPIAEAVRADLVFATEPIIGAGGLLTGEVVRSVIGRAKADVVDAVVRDYGIDQDRTYGYGDHASDLPMLTRVAHRRIRGSDPALLDAARSPDWELLGDGTGDQFGASRQAVVS